ncbi:MAG: enoyl-CoA hydratase [Thermonema sp.]|jgi:enoyl-CoA hydratase|uniref:enoyl-CoA hydratase/isomerase family protein n=1 Tax=Thermonema TaxID=28194 RepID=UPI000570F53F|nr:MULTISPECIES: enoyl-CoA hydratase-related protein [Thermonema]GIV39847.1 MAG: enoyl-CoA hydratase [Thermonema sp.]
MPDFKNILFEVNEGIALITINRESKLNALNAATLEELHEAMQIVYDDDSIRGVIITGAGQKAFVAGADIAEIAQLTELDSRKFSEVGQEIFAMIEQAYKPVIAAVNGFALGGGCELAMACHLRIAVKTAKFGLPEVKLGVIPGYGGTQRLPQLVGKGRALEMILTAEMIDATKALDWGLVNRVVDTYEELMPAAQELMAKILKNSPKAIGLAIQCVNASYNEQENGYQTEANSFRLAAKSEDFKEGTSAFLEKRTPHFTGK